MLTSQWALVIPLNEKLHLKVAVVPGNTPFLLSNALLRTLGAIIDTKRSEMWSHEFNFKVPLVLTSRGLFLLDINQLLHHMWPTSMTKSASNMPISCPSSKVPETDHVERLPSKEELHVSDRQSHSQDSKDDHTITCNVTDISEPCHDSNPFVDSTPSDNHHRSMQHLSPNPCMTENIQDQEVQSRPVSSHSCDCVFHSHDRPCRSSEEGADRGAQQGVDRHAFERIGPRKDSVRQETPWKNVPAGLGFRSSVDSVVCKPLPPQQRLQSPQVLDVRGEESSRTGIHRGDCSQDKWRSRRDHTDASSSQGQDDTKGQDGPLRGRLHGGGVRSDQWDRPESCVPITRSAGCGCVAVSDAQPRECHDRDHFSPEESAAAAVDCNPDRTILLAGDHHVDFPEHLEPFCSGPTEKKKFQNLVRQYEREYQELRPQHRPKTFRKSDLIEVFCGPQSTLTDQGNKQGLRAQRFTINNGDVFKLDQRYLRSSRIRQLPKY